MARKRRIEFSGAVYHVRTRGNNRELIFMDDADREALMDGLADAVARDGLIVYAFCFMNNHFHLLVETSDAALNRVMRRLLTKYSRGFNKRHSRVGHVFQSRYRASLCEKDSYLLELIRYIHLNPVRAGLVDSPRDWRWSSHRTYMGDNEYPMLSVEPMLEMFGKRRSSARRAFEKFVYDGIGNTPPEILEEFEREKDGNVLGSGSFHQKARRAAALPKRRHVDLPQTRRRIDDLLQEVARKHGIASSAISGASQSSQISEARVDFFFAALEAGWKQSEIARTLKRTDSWASHLRRRHTRHFPKD